MENLQITLTITLLIIEVVAFAWLIIDIQKSKKNQNKIIELERKALGLELPKKELSVDTLLIEKDLLTSLFVKFTKVDSNELSYLNPTFIGAYIPKSNLGYSLLVPSEVKVLFENSMLYKLAEKI